MPWGQMKTSILKLKVLGFKVLHRCRKHSLLQNEPRVFLAPTLKNLTFSATLESCFLILVLIGLEYLLIQLNEIAGISLKCRQEIRKAMVDGVGWFSTPCIHWVRRKLQPGVDLYIVVWAHEDNWQMHRRSLLFFP